MKTILRAMQQDWGPEIAGSWSSSTYSVFDNGMIIAETKFRPKKSEENACMEQRKDYGKVLYTSMRVSDDTVDEIKAKIINLKKNHVASNDYLDGTAWEITAFDNEGKVVFHFPLNQIYDFPDLKELVALIPVEPGFGKNCPKPRR